jgi:hypothetical protein
LLDEWDIFCAEEDLKDKIHSLVEGPSFVFFFKKGDIVYGAPEESRVTFARMKTDDKDMPEGWEEEATFMAINLTKVVRNDPGAQTVFSYKDIKKIKVLDKKQAYKKLLKQSKETGGGTPDSPHAGRIALIIRKHRIITPEG